MTTVIFSILALGALALAFGALLGYTSIKFKVEQDPIVDQIDAILPQTQCGQCGFAGCRPYAEAIANGEAINRCPPGGEGTVQKLADLLGREAEPMDGADGEQVKKTAFIREAECIGCTKCSQVCPVDAILGTNRQMHTILTNECTGCGLCIDPCPVECIDLNPVQITPATWNWKAHQIKTEVVY